MKGDFQFNDKNWELILFSKELYLVIESGQNLPIYYGCFHATRYQERDFKIYLTAYTVKLILFDCAAIMEPTNIGV